VISKAQDKKPAMAAAARMFPSASPYWPLEVVKKDGEGRFIVKFADFL